MCLQLLNYVQNVPLNALRDYVELTKRPFNQYIVFVNVSYALEFSVCVFRRLQERSNIKFWGLGEGAAVKGRPVLDDGAAPSG